MSSGLLRAAPTGEERGAPHYTVSVSPQRPLEIVLPTLPVFQGAAVSSECLSQYFPPGDVAELRASAPLRGSLEHLVRPSPVGPPLQGTELVAPSTPEASLERLVPLVDYLAAWKLLPNVSHWVLQTVERGYRIQFGAPPPPFQGVFLTLVGPEQALVLEQEVNTLLRKEAIEVVPPLSRQGVRVLQPVLHCSKEGWGVASDFRSAAIEPLSHASEVQNAHCQTGRVSDQVRGLVCHDRSKRRMLPYLHPSQSQEVPEVCFQGQSLPISGSSLRPSTLTPYFHEVCGCCSGSSATPGHPHTQLHRRLVDFSSFRADDGSTSRCHSRSYERVGVKAKRQEKCAFSITEDHLSGRGVGFNHDAGTFVSCSDRVDPHRSHESQRRPVTHCQAVSEAAGSDGSCVQRDTFWPAVHETPTVVAQDQGVLPEGKPALHDQGHAVMPTCLGHVEETLVLVLGPGAGSSLSPRNASDRRVPHRLGSGHEWPPCPRSVEWSPSHVAHQLPGNAGRVSSTQTLSSRPKRSPCVGAHRQHSSGLLHKPPGRSAFAPLIQAGAPDPCVVSGQTSLIESSSYSWVSQYGSRHPVEAGAEARGMDASPRGGEADMESFWPGPGGFVCDSSDIALSPLVLSDSSSSAGAGCYGTDLAEASSVHFSPIALLPGVLERVRRDGVRLLLVAPFWPGRVWFSDLITLLDGSPWQIPVRRDLLSQAEGMILHPRPELWKLWVWPLRGHNS